MQHVRPGLASTHSYSTIERSVLLPFEQKREMGCGGFLAQL